jgi:hypothetical protein
MPKATKERPKHAASLSVQLQSDRHPLASESKRSQKKRKAVEDQEAEKDVREQVVDGKLGRQILRMAQEQQEEEDNEEESLSEEEEEDMKWRDIEYFLSAI